MMDTTERELVAGSIRHLLSATPAAELPEQLLESGWGELLADDPHSAVAVVAEEQGRACAASPVLDLVLLHGAGLELDTTTALVLPPLDDTVLSARDGRVDGLALAGHERAERWLVPTDTGLVAMAASQFERRSVRGFDATAGLARVTGTITDNVTVASPEAWAEAVRLGRLALSSELVGLASRMLDDTLAYVLERHQFGRPIASFQTVKHRLADVRVSITAARSGIEAAWEAGTGFQAMAAKALAGRAHRLASTHCHQVHGGIVFTVEHGFHRFMNRGYLLDGLLGSAASLTMAIGRELADGQIPRVPALPET